MIVRNRKDAVAITQNSWKSERLLLKKDGMGFSFHITTIAANSETKMHYKNHLESVYCIRGEGELVDLATNEVHKISAGTIYALNNNDKHILRCKTEMEFACVFNPPCSGAEHHDENGTYAAS